MHEYIMNLLGRNELEYLLIRNADTETILSLSATNKKLRELIYNNDYIWIHLLSRDFQFNFGNLSPDRNPRKFYSRIRLFVGSGSDSCNCGMHITYSMNEQTCLDKSISEGHLDLVERFVKQGKKEKWIQVVEKASQYNKRNVIDYGLMFVDPKTSMVRCLYQWVYFGHLDLIQKYLQDSDPYIDYRVLIEQTIAGRHIKILEYIIKEKILLDRDDLQNPNLSLYTPCRESQAGLYNLLLAVRLGLYDSMVGRWSSSRNSGHGWYNTSTTDYLASVFELIQTILPADDFKNMVKNLLPGIAFKGDIILVNLLDRFGADTWNSAMLESIKGGHRDVLKLCIKKGANNWNEAMIAAIKKRYVELVYYCVKKGANSWDEGLEWSHAYYCPKLIDFFKGKGAVKKSVIQETTYNPSNNSTRDYTRLDFTSLYPSIMKQNGMIPIDLETYQLRETFGR